MRRLSALSGRATRVVLVAAGLTAWAYVISLDAGTHSQQPASPPAPAARVVVTGTGDVLAIEQAAESAQGAAYARNPHNLLFTTDHSVYASVGSYTDCTGRAPLTRAAAAIDTCVVGLRYFIGHNPGVFTGLRNVSVGGMIGYYDSSGHLHLFEVIAQRTWLRSNGVPPPAEASVTAQFQTCVTSDGSVDRILDAVEA